MRLLQSFLKTSLLIGITAWLSACGTTGATQSFVLNLDLNQGSQIVSDVRVASVATDTNEAYLNAINVQPWGKFDSDDLQKIDQSLRDTFAQNLPKASPNFKSKLNIHLFIRRYVVSTSNTGGGVLATVAWAVTNSQGKLIFDEQFYAWGSGYLVTTVGAIKTSVHRNMVRRIATITMALASDLAGADFPPATFDNTSTSLEEAISRLPQTLVSMGNPVLVSFPNSTVSTIGYLTPSGILNVQWEVVKASENFDWQGYLENIKIENN